MKYIMFDCVMNDKEGDEILTRRVPVIFPNAYVHADIAKYLQRVISMDGLMDTKVHSAGEINLIVESAHGESETLKVRSDPTDANIISAYDYLHGLV